MEYPFYSETIDIGEESFQPDYYELDEEGDSASVVASSCSIHASGEGVAGKRIVIKKPAVQQLPVLAATRQRKRPWRSSSRNDDVASNVSDDESTATVETAAVETVVVSLSSVKTSALPAEASLQSSSIDEELLEGVG